MPKLFAAGWLDERQFAKHQIHLAAMGKALVKNQKQKSSAGDVQYGQHVLRRKSVSAKSPAINGDRIAAIANVAYNQPICCPDRLSPPSFGRARRRLGNVTHQLPKAAYCRNIRVESRNRRAPLMRGRPKGI